MELVTKIQKVHLQLVGSKTQAEVGTFLDETLKDVVTFHDWLCLIDYEDLPLVANTSEYILTGTKDNLAKLLMVLPTEVGLVDPYVIVDKDRFYKEILNQQSKTPGWCVILKRPREYSLRVRIYPTPSSDSTGKYFFKKIAGRSDIKLFANENVFIFGVLARWWSAQKTSDPVTAASFGKKAERFWMLYRLGLKEMKQSDDLEVFPEARIRLAESTKDFFKRAFRDIKRGGR